MFNRTFFKSFIRLALVFVLLFSASSNVNYQQAYAAEFVLFEVPSFSFIYSNDGMSPNSEIRNSFRSQVIRDDLGQTLLKISFSAPNTFYYIGDYYQGSWLNFANWGLTDSMDHTIKINGSVRGSINCNFISNYGAIYFPLYISDVNKSINTLSVLVYFSYAPGSWSSYIRQGLGTPIIIQPSWFNQAPSLTLTTSDNQGLSEVPGYNNLALTGTVKDPDAGDTVLVKYTIDGLAAHTNKTIATITADGTNQAYSYNLPIDSSIPQGSYTYRVWAEDNNGGISTEVVKHFIVDKTPPINSASPEKQETWKTTPITINVSVSDDAAGVKTRQYELTQSSSPSGTWVTAGDNTYQVIINTDGEWYLHVNTTDRAGNHRLDTYGPYRYADFSMPTGIAAISPTASTVDVTWNQVAGQEYQVQIKDDSGTIISTSDWEAVAPYKFVDLLPNTRYIPEVRSRKLGIDSGFIQGVAQYTDAISVRTASFDALDKAIKITLDIDGTGNPAGTKYVIKNLTTGEQSPEIEQMWTNTGLLNDMSYPYMARVIHRNGKVGEWFLIGTGHTATTEIIVPGDWKDPLGGLTPIKLPEEFDPDTIGGKAVEYNGTVAIVVKGRDIIVSIQNVKNATKYAISLDGFGFSVWKDLDSSGSFTETITVNQPGLYKVHVKFQNAFGGESPAYVRHFLLDWIKPEITTTQKIKGQTATTNGSFTVLGDGEDNLSPILYYTGSGWQWFTPSDDIALSGITLDNTRKDVTFRFSDLNGNVTTRVYKLWAIQR